MRPTSTAPRRRPSDNKGIAIAGRILGIVGAALAIVIIAVFMPAVGGVIQVP